MSSFFEAKKQNGRTTLGKTKIQYKTASSILSLASGFLDSYDFTLNPYSGCSFGCTYCYAAFFTRSAEQQKNWGYWVQVKENALQLLMKFRKNPLQGKRIYMSSVTDPYQPIERELELTRSLLKEMADYHRPRLVIQTRSPLVTRDIDLLKRFKTIQVNMTITTDDENVRKVFEPYCPSNASRLKAIREVTDAGINTCITLTPLLPIHNPESFADTLNETGVKKFVVQSFHSGKRKFIAGTRETALGLIHKLNWTPEKYNEVEALLIKRLCGVEIGKEGFTSI